MLINCNTLSIPRPKSNSKLYKWNFNFSKAKFWKTNRSVDTVLQGTWRGRKKKKRQVYKLVVRAGSLCGIRETKMILRLPCSVTEPPSLEGQPAHITHASGQTLSELHTRQERSPSLALLLPFSNSSFPPRAFLTLPSAIRMTILLPTAANSTPFSDPVTLSSNGGGILLQSTKKQIKQSYKVESHHPQSRTVSLPKAAVPTSDAQRHKSSSLK